MNNALALPVVCFALLFGSVALGQTRVVDGDTIDLNGVRIRLNGIDAPEFGQTCGTWRCGEAALEKLAALIGSSQLNCDASGSDGYGRTIATCYAADTDIGEEMVRAGYAWAFVKYSAVYEEQEEEARAKRLGIWRFDSIPAWDYRAATWAKAEQTAPAGCPIKGNISDNGKIYHAPWSPWYTKTRIKESKGERWFCSEAEALSAGWRAPVWR